LLSENLETIACKFYFSLKLVIYSRKSEISFFVALKQTLDASAKNSAHILSYRCKENKFGRL
jgi:hypothetical protein